MIYGSLMFPFYAYTYQYIFNSFKEYWLSMYYIPAAFVPSFTYNGLPQLDSIFQNVTIDFLQIRTDHFSTPALGIVSLGLFAIPLSRH
jgi:hypothetical protein